MAERTAPQLIEEAVARYEAGMSGPEAAKATGVSQSVLYRHLRARGIRPCELQRWRGIGVRRVTEEMAQKFVEGYREGKSLSMLAKEYGVALQTVHNNLVRLGEPLRRRGKRAREFTPQQVAQMLSLWKSGVSQRVIGEQFGISQTLVSKLLDYHGFDSGHRRPRGERHGMWRGGRFNTNGYVAVLVPATSPFASMRHVNGYVPEHRLVMAQALGRSLLPTETVHHINGDGHDNRPENLQLRQGKHGRGTVSRCRNCGSHDIEKVPLASSLLD